MPDLTQEILPRLRQHRLPGLDLGGSFIYPNYDGKSILNLPSSICRLLGIEGLGAGPLAPEILTPLGDGIRCVILVLMDALALHRLQRWMADGSTPVWKKLTQDIRLAEAGVFAPLTSIVPSTTSSALTSMWTGRSAAEHSVMGYEMWMKEYGVVANTIQHSPITFSKDSGSLERAGFDPEKFLTFPTLGSHLSANGVQTFALQHRRILHSGLSQMFFKDVTTQAFNTAADLWINLRHLLEKRHDERLHIWIYWSEVDHFSHYYGPDDERPAAEFALFSTAFERLFLTPLSPQARKDTVFILTSDHGQIATPKIPHYELRNHPDLVRLLHILPTCENRLAFLYVRPGQIKAVREYLQHTWPGQFTVLDVPYAIEKGLFGPGDHHPRLYDRAGDLMVLAHDDAYLWWADKKNPLLGRHGGLHPDEMLVPFLAVRL